ncbi:hypothetical protein ACLEX4_04570 [Pseudescherichia vulneris]
MLRLYTLWELEREVSPEDFQYILTPDAALEKAVCCYDLDYRNYTSPPFGEVPRQLSGQLTNNPYKRADRTISDPVFDDLEMNLAEGWIIGLDTDENWNDTINPFYIDDKSELIFDYHDSFCWMVSDFQSAYQKAINSNNGRKPAPTVKFQPSGEPVQHAQAAKTINSKAAVRLLAAGGIYNGNVEGFHNTAEQLGGDASAGYDQIMNDQTKGTVIAAASVAAAFGLGRMGMANEVSELKNLHVLGKVDGEFSAIKPGPLPDIMAETFSGGAYKEITLSEDTIFYRSGVEGEPFGQYFGYEQPQGVLQSRIDKALLPKWPNGGESPVNAFHEIQIPAGTKAYVGQVGFQTDLYSGGTEQVVILKPWENPNVKILSSRGLQ